ncbi:hypothetical protein JOF53_004790 [Crossiella equi]|uniref:DUF371 domain-containing protein n=1 Tax=Crossiella equi TaxID=130796 RepID=A0ABS5AH58_9PSEU|nr:DUF371 domain-containing protein [Crossiella equi]MBP2475918.1 hypothetical protein [Crossiella equi]
MSRHIRLRATGHPEIRATHAKTWELTPDRELTTRATCVLGVGATGEGPALAGPVELRLSVGESTVVVRALGNPHWVPGGPAVVRLGPARLPNTLATDADLSSADLPRELAARLADPATEITVDVLPVADPGTLVLFAATGPSARLDAELAAADVVLAEDAGARALARPRGSGTEGRVLVVATEDLPGPSLTHRPAAVEVVGLPPGLAAAAASPVAAPVFLAQPGRKPADSLRNAPLTARVVLRVPADLVPKVLDVARERGSRSWAYAVEPYAESERPRWGGLDELIPPSRGEVWLCVDPAPGEAGLDPDLRKLLTGLLAEGVSAKTLAKTLADLPGQSRRTAYDTVQGLKDLRS